MNVLQKVIVLNLSDGITTPVSYLLPAILLKGNLPAKELIIGTIGAAVSMAFAFKSAEATEGTWTEWIIAFICSALGGILPILTFILFPKPVAAVLSLLLIASGIMVISYQKKSGRSWRPAIWDTSKNILPALLIVGVLSIL